MGTPFEQTATIPQSVAIITANVHLSGGPHLGFYQNTQNGLAGHHPIAAQCANRLGTMGQQHVEKVGQHRVET